ncbi:MAG TPA: sigma-70 family RNA polymerase sigma factor [Pyrinomonadaceae bacterium]|nr:sigma-70 family RNA polymerase sigma factor [Pyrinomonadaceae bacterium]
MTPSENELVRRAQAGDADAFALLAKQFERRVYTLALYYTRERRDAEDLSQEVWLKAFSALGQFRGESGFYTWLRQITVNTFLNHRRARAAVPESESAADDAAASDCRPQRVEEDFHRRILVEKVFRALGELTPQQRLIFLLKHREGMTYEEISHVFNCSTGTVKKAQFRALTKLRRHLGVEVAPLEYAPCGPGRKD